ncbi:MAG: AraC family transcriptional regulator [Pseudomonadota bacterium]
MPAMRDAGWQSDQRVEVLHIYLCDEALRKIAETVTGKTATDVSISDGLDLNDPFMAGIAGKILREIQSPSALSSLMIEHLQHVIAVHMLRTYSNLSDPTVKALTRPIRMGKSDLQPALDYLNDNIQESVSLDDLADLANVPTSQLLRSFRYVIGTTPHQYLIQRRIEKARDLLTNTRLSIAEIAYECGFSSQSHMTTVFADKLGITPGKYRRQVR